MTPVVQIATDAYINNNQVQLLISGDEAAFRAVYDRHSEKVFRLAFRYLKDRQLSEEIVQETFIRLWLNKSGLDAGGDIWSYLSLIAKRLSLNSLRDIARSTGLTIKLLSNIEEACNGTEENIYASDLAQITEKLINKLPRQQQQVYQLSRMQGLSYKEIAEQLCISPNTVKNHMVQALKTLKAKIYFSYFLCLALFLFSK
jgi:RNA polymerase sigma-70 factor (family 1)